jgi:predicted DNA-binding protein
MSPAPRRTEGKTRAISLRLDTARLEALNEIADRTERLRSELLIEAVDHWLLMEARGIDVEKLMAAIDTMDPEHPQVELRAADDATKAALDLINTARSRLLASILGKDLPKV